MKVHHKVEVFWSIIWSIFLFALGFMLATGLSAIFKSTEPEYGYKVKRFEEDLIERLDDSLKTVGRPEYEFIEPEPLIAEPLHGEELYRFYVAQIHEQHYPDVDPYIALAVLETESNYNPNALSKAGAVGLMQIIPQYHLRRAKKYGLNDPWDPYTNIICGMDFLNELINIYGSWNRALLGYNNSQTYVRIVLEKAESLKGGGYFGQTC